MYRSRDDAVDELVEHLKANCDAAIILHEPGQFADDEFQGLIDAGWTWSDQVDSIAGKRIRYLIPPEEQNDGL